MNQSICNICGANYEYRKGRWVCSGCGAYKPEELSAEVVTLLQSAAQKLRFADFDEAEKAYSDIIEQYPGNAEGYFGRLLAKYGIKYEDDFDGRKIPTCYAASIESVMTDKDYLRAIELADGETREYYKLQAGYIERVRKEWIEKADKEDPYDIFISYKESDSLNGIDRTNDSIKVMELYNHLKDQGYRVFYSRESLRGKVGEKFEPYIFNALSTAKVMLVYGTSAEYITSTWVKNEWHRYYRKVAAGEKHAESLVIACDGFSPSELPSILSSRQCFDASRMTFVTDLDKHVAYIIAESAKKAEAPKIKAKAELLSGLHEHRYKSKVVKSSCVSKGYTLYTCDCGYEYKDTYTPLSEHNFKLTKTKQATCSAEGYDESTCEICGEKQRKPISKTDHQYSKWVVEENATCTANGKSQRKCLYCGAIEVKEIPFLGHSFSDANLGVNDGAEPYCLRCGISKRTAIATAHEMYKDAIQTPYKAPKNDVITLGGIFKNMLNYWRGFFTKETTVWQKIKHFNECLLTLCLVCGLISLEFDTSAMTAVILFIAFYLSFPLYFCVLVVGFFEKRSYKKQGRLYPKLPRLNLGFRFISNFMLVCAAMFMTMAICDLDGVVRSIGAVSALYLGFLSFIAMMYTHLPRRYRKIQYIENTRPIHKISLGLVGGLVATLIMIIGIITIAVNAPLV